MPYAIVVGYGNVTNGYRLYDLVSEKVIHSRDVKFNEQPKQEMRQVSMGTDDSDYKFIADFDRLLMQMTLPIMMSRKVKVVSLRNFEDLLVLKKLPIILFLSIPVYVTYLNNRVLMMAASCKYKTRHHLCCKQPNQV